MRAAFAKPGWRVAAFLLAVLAATFFEGLTGRATFDGAGRLPFEDALYRCPVVAMTPLPFIDPTAELMHQPSDHLTAAEWRAGRLPLWNPHGGLGTPLLANGDAAPFNPLKWLFLVPGDAAGLPQAWFLVSRLVVLALGMVVLARQHGLGPWGTALAALAGTLSGFSTYHFHFSELHTLPLFPWLLWAAARFREQPDARRTAAFGLLIGLTGLMGHPEMALFAAGAAWVAAATGGGGAVRRRLGGLCLAGALGAGTAAILVLPFLDHVRGSIGYLLDRPATTAYGFADMLKLQARHFLFVEADVNAYNFNAWVGTPALCLVPLGLASRPVRRLVFPVLGVYLVALAILPPSNLVNILKVAANSFYLPPLLIVPLALLAGAGLDRLLERPGDRPALAAALAGFVLAALVAALNLHNPAYYATLPRAWGACAFGLPFGLAALAARWLPRAVTGTVVVGLAAVELSLGARIAIPQLPRFAFESPPVVRKLQADPLPFRVTGQDYLLRPNTGTFYDLDHLDLLQAFYPQRYIAFMDALNGRPRAFPTLSIVEPGCKLALLDLANVRYLLLYDGDAAMKAVVAAHPARFRSVLTQPAVTLLENVQALPRTWVASGADFTTAALAPGRLAGNAERWRDHALVETPDGQAPAGWRPGGPARGSAVVTVRSSQSMEVVARLEAPGWLVVSELYDPNWTATVDGQPAPVYPADVALRALPLAAGRHVVRMRYASRLVDVAAGISLVSLLLGLVLLLRPARQSMRATTAT
ncbi:MAG: hypothetical protein JWM80_1361 [Cyanobacteria bacterium RYN_339]|nr:hypothetical protein [Cyanobacteria bacterium RYN_339]